MLSDLTERYIQLVGRKAMEFAEHAGHNQADHIDVFAALADMGTQPHSLRNLIDFTGKFFFIFFSSNRSDSKEFLFTAIYRFVKTQMHCFS